MAKRAASTTGQVTRFGAVGILNTLIDYIIFIGLTKVFAIPLNRVWVAKLASGTVAMVNSFYFNRSWVFRVNGRNSGRQFLRFILATVVGVYVIQLGLVQFFSTGFPAIGHLAFHIASTLGLVGLVPKLLTESFIIKTVAFGLATLASLTWNFLLYKFVVFN